MGSLQAGSAMTEDEALEQLPPSAEELVYDMSVAARIAEMCHAVNRVYCESLNDFSQDSWADANQLVKDSCIAGVAYLAQHTEATPEDVHDAWVRYKEAEGWVYGLEKNAEFKRHPNLVPWHKLNSRQQAKDRLFVTICRTMFAWDAA